MIIEWLKFKVSPDLREDFIRIDEKIWTNRLKTYRGFLSKEVLLNPEKVDEVVMVIRWRNRQEWKNIPLQDLTLIEKEFAQKIQGENYHMLESLEYKLLIQA